MLIIFHPVSWQLAKRLKNLLEHTHFFTSLPISPAINTLTPDSSRRTHTLKRLLPEHMHNVLSFCCRCRMRWVTVISFLFILSFWLLTLTTLDTLKTNLKVDSIATVEAGLFYWIFLKPHDSFPTIYYFMGVSEQVRRTWRGSSTAGVR